MSTKKLEKVLEYLINNQEDKAKDLLHQVFIEKARAIHEDFINNDEGDDFIGDVDDSSDELDNFSDEIDTEETAMSEDGSIEALNRKYGIEEEDDMDMGSAEGDIGDELEVGADDDDDMGDMGDDDMGDMGDDDMMDMGDDDMGDMGDMGDDNMGDIGGDVDFDSIESTMNDLEDALAELKAEFEKLEAEGGSDEEVEDEEVEDEAGEEEEAEGEVEDEAGEEEEAEGEEEEAEGEEEEELDENMSWLDEFEDFSESVELQKVSAPSGEGEIGSGHYTKTETNTKSPIAKAPTSTLGAKPVKVNSSSKSGYEREAAPSAESLKGVKDNRRRKSTDGMSKVSKEGDGGALLNKKGDGFGETGKRSPLSTSPRK